MSDSPRPAKRARKSTTTTPASLNQTSAPAAADALPLSYFPTRAIPPIASAPPSQCPLPDAHSSTILSRQYDLATGLPLYRVRIHHHQPSSSSSPHTTPPSTNDEPSPSSSLLDIPLDDILTYVSPAELEAFELTYIDDIVAIVDADGSVLLVSREAQQAMMNDGAPSTTTTSPRNPSKRAPTQAFIDTLPPPRRRGRPPKNRQLPTASTVPDTDEEAESDGVGYGAWVDPANVRGTRPVEDAAAAGGSEDELALSLARAREGRGASSVGATRDEEDDDSDDDDESFHSAAEEAQHHSSAAALLAAFGGSPAAKKKKRLGGSSMLHPPAEAEAEAQAEVEAVGAEAEEEEECEIEGIIKHKEFAGETVYLVKWAGWPEDEVSWFTAEELDGAREVLEEYLEEFGGEVERMVMD